MDIKVATGKYINVFNDELDVFVIINDANGRFTFDQCWRVEDIVTEYFNNPTEDAKREMENKLNEVFEYVQIIIKNMR